MYDYSVAIGRLFRPLSLAPERDAGPVDRAYHRIQHWFRVLSFRRAPTAVAALSTQAEEVHPSPVPQSVVPALNHLRGIANTGAGDLSTTREALLLVCEAAQEYVNDGVSPEQQRGAMLCLRGGIACLPTAPERRLALALSAATAAGLGIPVTILLGDDRHCREFHAAFAFFFASLNLKPGLVTSELQKAERSRQYRAEIVCTTLRQAANDYLLDRLLEGAGRDLLARRMEPLLRPASSGARLVHQVPGLLLVEDADQQLIDQASMPISISGGDGHLWTGTVLKQAFDLAQEMVAERDYLLDGGGAMLSLIEEGRERLRGAAAGLARLWEGDRLREELVVEALVARDLLQEGVDFEIENGGLVLLRGQFEAGRPDLTRERLQFLKLWRRVDDSMDPEMLARTYVQRFVARYPLVGGVAGYLGSARASLWQEYGCPALTVAADTRLRPRDLRLVVVSDPQQRETGVMHRLGEISESGDTILMPVRGRALYRNLAAILEREWQAQPPAEATPRLRRYRNRGGGGMLLLIPLPDCLAMLNAAAGEGLPRVDCVMIPEEPESLRVLGRCAEALIADSDAVVELVLCPQDSAFRSGVAGRLLAALTSSSELPASTGNPVLKRLLWYALARREYGFSQSLRDSARADEHIYKLLAFAGLSR